MDKAGLSEAAQGAFKLNYEQLVRGVTGLVRGGRLLQHRRLAGGSTGAFGRAVVAAAATVAAVAAVTPNMGPQAAT